MTKRADITLDRIRRKVCRHCGKDVPLTAKSFWYCDSKCRVAYYKEKRKDKDPKASHNSRKQSAIREAQIASETLTAILTHSTFIEAAEALGITDDGLIKRRKKYDLDRIIALQTEEARMRLQYGSIKAANKLVSLIDDKRIGFDASKEVLDRVGLGGSKGNSAMGVELKDGDRSLKIVVTRSE